jgi:hypothetical protein
MHVSVSFGWCLTGQHDKCPGRVVTWHSQVLVCACCHGEEESGEV